MSSSYFNEEAVLTTYVDNGDLVILTNPLLAGLTKKEAIRLRDHIFFFLKGYSCAINIEEMAIYYRVESNGKISTGIFSISERSYLTKEYISSLSTDGRKIKDFKKNAKIYLTSQAECDMINPLKIL